MMSPAWRDFDEVWTLSVQREGVIHIAQVVRDDARRWALRVQRSDRWERVHYDVFKTKTEAQDAGAEKIGYPVPKREKPAPTLAQLRAAAPEGTSIDDEGDRYEAFAPAGYRFCDVHSLIEWHDDTTISKQAARRDLAAALKAYDLEPCEPENEECRAHGCFEG